MLHSSVHYRGDYGFIPQTLPDDKILAVPVHDPYYEEFFDIADIPQDVLREIEYFFATYKTLEGKTVDIKECEKREIAMSEIARSVELYRRTYLERNSS